MKITILLIIYLIYAVFMSYTDIKSKEVYCLGNYLFFICSVLLTPFFGNIQNVILLIFYALIIFVTFKIFQVGDGDTEMFISLFPLLLYFGKYNANRLIELLIMQLILSLGLALIGQIVLKIKELIQKNNNGKITLMSSFAFAPYIFLSTSIIIIKTLI